VLSIAAYPVLAEIEGTRLETFRFFSEYEEMDAWNVFLLSLPNIFILGQDYAAITKYHEFHPVVPAWSIASELTFYAVAPFLVLLRTRILFLVFLVSIAARIFFYYTFSDNFIYRISLPQIPLFIAGMLAYQTDLKRIIPQRLTAILVVIFLALTVYYVKLTGLGRWGELAKWTTLMLILFVIIEPVFNKTKYSAIDRFFGNIGYPVYISHYLVITVLSAFIPANNDFFTISVIITTLVFSTIGYFLVDRKIDQFRQSRIVPVADQKKRSNR